MRNCKNPDALVSVLTGGRDKPYALGLAAALLEAGASFDFIGSDEVNSAELRQNQRVNLLNLRGDQSTQAGTVEKINRVLKYYWRLVWYAARARPKTFHILWNNKFEWFDRTVLMAYYRLLGKRIVLTAHNVNAGRRDGNDSLLNRLGLGIQYRLCHHIFLHTTKMRDELCSEFRVPRDKTTVIPLGINRTVPITGLTGAGARERLGLAEHEKVILFFGQIAPYKGLEILVAAFQRLYREHPDWRLMIVGRPKGPKEYWEGIRETIACGDLRSRVLQRIEFIADEETEVYFKAADVLVLPYHHIFQSGVLFLAYSFGVPVIAADVGSLREEIVEGETGLVFEPKNVAALAQALQKYFASNLHRDLERNRPAIQHYADEKYSWDKVMAATLPVYSRLAALTPLFQPRYAANKK